MVLAKNRKHQLVIYGATGFTGKYVVEILANYISNKNIKLKWAVAGRNKQKLDDTLDQVAEILDIDLSDIPVIVCDNKSEVQIYEMATNTQVILNCVGPFSLYGEQIVSVCVHTSTHHLDISGEPLFLERMELKYDNEAKKNGTYIIGSCGWDSIPAEIGFQRAKRYFVKNIGTPYYVESYIKTKNPKGSVINSGTWKSLIDSFSHTDDLKRIRDAKPALPKNALRAKKCSIFYSDYLSGYCVSFGGSDRSVVYRTQRYFYNKKRIQPIDYEPYLFIGQWYNVVALIPIFLIFSILICFQCSRNFMKNHPSLCSLGLFSDEGPTREMVLNSKSSHFFIAKGTKVKDANLAQEIDQDDLVTSVTAIDGPNPGYIATPIYLVQCALAVINEHSNLPSEGGVYTPAVAFANTHLERSLSYEGIQFSTIDLAESDRLSMSSTGSYKG